MTIRAIPFTAACLAIILSLAGCREKVSADAKAEAPPPASVEREADPDHVKVDHPEQFPLAIASESSSASELNATGVVSADVARTIPVISLAAGRVLEVHARLGDTVTKGQLLMKVQSADVSQAYSDSLQAQADEGLARAQLDRAQLLFDKGAIAAKDLEVTRSAETKAKVTVQTTLEHLRVLGADPQHPSAVIEIRAPVAGVITDQQVVASAGVQGLSGTTPFTISDLSTVWILCDVYENDLSQVRVGEYAGVRLNAYPDRAFQGRIGNISPVLDPALRTAKVRLEIRNPGIMRIGMFVTATFRGAKQQKHAEVPATAVLHLHDRDWVYRSEGAGKFQRVSVVAGKMSADKMQEVLSGLAPGDQVVKNALVLQNTVEQ